MMVRNWIDKIWLFTTQPAAFLFMLAVAFIIALILSGCTTNDASIDSRDHAPASVINFPNHFSSVAHKCDGHGHRVFEADHGEGSGKQFSAIAVIDDPSCGGTR
jgi:hypothetical protein